MHRHADNVSDYSVEAT